METKSTAYRFNQHQKKIFRRRDLLPLWIKIFIWIFLVFGVSAILLPAADIFLQKMEISIYGFSTSAVFSFAGIFILSIFILKGIVAYGLWTEKKLGGKTCDLRCYFRRFNLHLCYVHPSFCFGRCKYPDQIRNSAAHTLFS